MLLRLALSIGLAAAIAAPAAVQPSWAQSSKPPAAADVPTAAPAPAPAPATPAPGATALSGDAFGQDVNLTAQPMVYVKGTGTWDNAFATITAAFRKLKAYLDKAALNQDGPAMTIFTATDDRGFEFEAALPVAAPPQTPPGGDIVLGTSPSGHALKFVHRGSYDTLDNTYEAVTNYLDEKGLDAKDLFIEQYATDPLTANADHLVVNILVPVK